MNKRHLDFFEEVIRTYPPGTLLSCRKATLFVNQPLPDLAETGMYYGKVCHLFLQEFELVG